MAAQQYGLRFFFPGAAKFLTGKSHGNGGHFPGTAPQVAAHFVGPKNDVKKTSSIQIIEVFRRMLYFIRLPRTLIDEAPHRLRVRNTQAMRLLHFVEPLKLSVAVRDKMLPAKCFTVKHRIDSLVASLDATPFDIRHAWKTHSLRG